MNKHIIAKDILNEIDGKTIPQVIRLLQDYQDAHGNERSLTISVEYDWDVVELQVVRIETEQEKKERLLREKERLLREKEEKAARKLEAERKRYLELKAKFEGE